MYALPRVFLPSTRERFGAIVSNVTGLFGSAAAPEPAELLPGVQGSAREHVHAHDREAFLAWVKTHKRCALFIDESASALDKWDTRFDWLATTGRHMGHISHFISHRLTQLSPTIRGQCMRRWIFAAVRSDAKALAEEHNSAALLSAADLRRPRVEIADVAQVCAR